MTSSTVTLVVKLLLLQYFLAHLMVNLLHVNPYKWTRWIGYCLTMTSIPSQLRPLHLKVCWTRHRQQRIKSSTSWSPALMAFSHQFANAANLKRASKWTITTLSCYERQTHKTNNLTTHRASFFIYHYYLLMNINCNLRFAIWGFWVFAFWMIFSVFQKNLVFGYSWSTLLWYRCYYPHRSKDALSTVCGIFFFK